MARSRSKFTRLSAVGMSGFGDKTPQGNDRLRASRALASAIFIRRPDRVVRKTLLTRLFSRSL